jgi:hypothetical protein
MKPTEKREDKKRLIIDTYEKILLNKRLNERQILNEVRDKEIQKNRPPRDGWYELKNHEFNQECYRNRVGLKPNNENKLYLKRLQDNTIY